jgi:TRAP-type C4-dicarboxylate transport system permease small subunit
MGALLKRIDDGLARFTDAVCVFLLTALTLVVIYSVVLRYIFSQPPFWSDVVSTFGNVGMILLGLSITVRGRELIAMQALYEKVSPLLAVVLDACWNVLILVFSMVFTIYGYQAAVNIPGFYWELAMMPHSYPMMIVPISGVLLVVACLGILVQDVIRIRVLLAGDAGPDNPSHGPTSP